MYGEKRTIGFFKITDDKIISLYKKYLSLKEDEDTWYDALLTFYLAEVKFSINIIEGKAEKIEDYKMGDADYQYFINKDPPYIMVRKTCREEFCKKGKNKLCIFCKILRG